MNESELSVLVEAKLAEQLAARLQADRDRVRLEVITALRREAERKHYDRINARHPIEDKYGGLTPAQHAARLRQMDSAAKRDMEKMDRANSRVIEGTLLHTKQRASLGGGSEGFKVK